MQVMEPLETTHSEQFEDILYGCNKCPIPI